MSVTRSADYYKEWYLKNKDRILAEAKTPTKRLVARENQRRRKQRLREETQRNNEKFIEENGLVEHPIFKGYYGSKDGSVFSNKGAGGTIRQIKPILNKHNNGYYMLHPRVNVASSVNADTGGYIYAAWADQPEGNLYGAQSFAR